MRPHALPGTKGSGLQPPQPLVQCGPHHPQAPAVPVPQRTWWLTRQGGLWVSSSTPACWGGQVSCVPPSTLKRGKGCRRRHPERTRGTRCRSSNCADTRLGGYGRARTAFTCGGRGGAVSAGKYTATTVCCLHRDTCTFVVVHEHCRHTRRKDGTYPPLRLLLRCCTCNQQASTFFAGA
jgi:hypothetical protein